MEDRCIQLFLNRRHSDNFTGNVTDNATEIIHRFKGKVNGG